MIKWVGNLPLGLNTTGRSCSSVVRALAAQSKCPGFDSRQLPAFPLSSIFTSNFFKLGLTNLLFKNEPPAGSHRIYSNECSLAVGQLLLKMRNADENGRGECGHIDTRA